MVIGKLNNLEVFKTNWNWVSKVLKVALRSGMVLSNLLETGQLSVKATLKW